MEIRRYADVGRCLVDAFPELQASYAARLKEAEDLGGELGQYEIFWYIVKPLFYKLLDSEQGDSTLRRLFGFFEDMARSPDIEVGNLLEIEIFESLVGQPERLRKAWSYMGPETKALARDMARIRRREKNLPA